MVIGLLGAPWAAAGRRALQSFGESAFEQPALPVLSWWLTKRLLVFMHDEMVFWTPRLVPL